MSKNITEHLEKILSNLPKTPWVYQMKDAKGGVMYVGKAKNLKNRVGSYFREQKSLFGSQTPLNPPLTGGSTPLSPAKRQMVAKICDIEIITCQTEVEALVLETNLIKHLTPKYNILMKDDKNLAYIKITNAPVPEIIKTRQKIRDGAIYFGPYVSAVEQCVRALRRIFRIRNCRMKFARTPLSRGDTAQREGGFLSRDQNQTPLNPPLTGGSRIQITDKAWKTIPCMDYYIGLCPAPCLLKAENLDQHSDHIAQAQRFLSGDSASVFATLTESMQSKAKNLEFEEAQEIKETIEALRWLHERQTVRDIIDGDVDIYIKYEKYDKVYMGITQIRSSQIVGVFRYEVGVGADEWDDGVVGFLMRQYIDTDDLPDVLLVREDILDDAFQSFLLDKKITLEIPKIWPKREMIDFTLTQLREYAYKKQLQSLENKTLTREHMKNILEKLGYPIPAKWEIVFECYDISHTDGHFTYASRVVMVDGRPDPSRYRKYKIKTLQDGDIDDYASHREVMIRRTIEWMEQDNFPHLIIIDGGKWQLSSALSGIKEGIWKCQSNEPILVPIPPPEKVSSSPLLGDELYRRRELEGVTQNKDSSYVTPPNLPFSGEELPPICSIAKREEEIFMPWDPQPIIFEKGTLELMVLQKCRDESHRFSITANRSARSKSMKKNILEELPGIWPITRKKLLKLAGSVDGIKDLSTEELSKICNVAQVETLRDHGLFGW
jgi:excinuclease ABC subunit C